MRIDRSAGRAGHECVMTTLVFNGGLQGLTCSRSEYPVLGPLQAVRTLADLPFHVLERSSDTVLMKRAIGRTFLEMTGAQLFEQVRELTLGLTQLGVAPGDRVAIISESRPEWVVADLATVAAGAMSVTSMIAPMK